MKKLAFDPITAALNLGTTILDRVLPDKQQNDAAKAALAQMVLNGEIQQITGQLQINLAEAQSKSVFVAGWRPAIGWLCGLGLLWQFFLAPILGVLLQTHHIPVIDSTSLQDLLFALLGMGTLRTVDKVKGQGSGN